MASTQTAEPRPFSALLKEERQRRNMSVAQCAKRAGVSDKDWRAFEDETPQAQELPTVIELRRVFGTNCQLQHRLPKLAPPVFVNALAPSGPIVVDAPIPRTAIALVPAPPPTAPPEAPPATYGGWLRRAREAARMKQSELAELVDCEQTTVSVWELDGGTPILDHFLQLLDLFPELARAPRPPRIRDMAKPVGPAGLALPTSPSRGKGGPTGSPVRSSAPPALPPPAPPASAPPGTPVPLDGLDLLRDGIALLERLRGRRAGNVGLFRDPDAERWNLIVSAVEGGILAESGFQPTQRAAVVALARLLRAELEEQIRALALLAASLPGPEALS